MGNPVMQAFTAGLVAALAVAGGQLRADEVHAPLVLPETGYSLALGDNLLDVDVPAPRADLVLALQAWLSAELGVPTVTDPPHFVFATPHQLLVMRYRTVVSDRSRPVGGPGEGDVVALYETDTGTVYLPRGWTGTSAAELSVLVHELVHHVQTVRGIRYGCAEAREAPAFDAQDRLLIFLGTDLEREFGIDPFTRLARALCLPG